MTYLFHRALNPFHPGKHYCRVHPLAALRLFETHLKTHCGHRTSIIGARPSLASTLGKAEQRSQSVSSRSSPPVLIFRLICSCPSGYPIHLLHMPRLRRSCDFDFRANTRNDIPASKECSKRTVSSFKAEEATRSVELVSTASLKSFYDRERVSEFSNIDLESLVCLCCCPRTPP